jgi:hypothetical protein
VFSARLILFSNLRFSNRQTVSIRNGVRGAFTCRRGLASQIARMSRECRTQRCREGRCSSPHLCRTASLVLHLCLPELTSPFCTTEFPRDDVICTLAKIGSEKDSPAEKISQGLARDEHEETALESVYRLVRQTTFLISWHYRDSQRLNFKSVSRLGRLSKTFTGEQRETTKKGQTYAVARQAASLA